MAGLVFSYEGELLHQATIYDQRDFLRSLLQAGVQGNANSQDPRGLTPVHTAALHDSIQCLEELLHWRGDPNTVSGEQDNCSTPLHFAARNGHLRCLKLLVDAGAKLETKDLDGRTACEVAYFESQVECANYLKIQENIKKAQRQEDVARELFEACAAGMFEKVKDLVNEVSPTAVNRLYQGGSTLLYKASAGGFLDIVKLLLDLGADACPNTYTGITPLYAACFNGHVDVARLLVNRMPELVNVPTRMEESTALHAAAGEGQQAIVKILLQVPEENEVCLRPCNGVNVNARTSSGMIPLHSAVSGRHLGVVKQLLLCKHQCKGPCRAILQTDVNARSIMGRTALHDAITVGHLEITKLLLEHNVDINLPVNSEQGYNKEDIGEVIGQPLMSPLEIACLTGNVEMVSLLCNRGAKDKDHNCLAGAIKSLNIPLAAVLLQQGVNVDNEHKLHGHRHSYMSEESWKNAKAVAIVWNSMKLSLVHPMWIVEAAKYINPNVEPGTSAMHPVLRTITRLDISSNKLVKLPLIVFQLPSLKSLNVSENSFTGLPSLSPRKRKEKEECNGLANGQLNGKLYRSQSNCHTISQSPESNEDRDSDFTYQESSWECPYLEELELHHNSLTTLPSCVFELPSLKYLNASFNDIDSLPFAMWSSPSIKNLDLKGNYLKNLPLFKARGKSTKAKSGKTSTLPRSKVLNPNKNSSEAAAKVGDENKIPEKNGGKVGPHANAKPQHLKVFCHRQLWGTSAGDEIEDSESDDEEIEVKKGSTLMKIDLTSNSFRDIPQGLPCLAPNLSTLIMSNNNVSELNCLAVFPVSLSSLDLSQNQLKCFQPFGNLNPTFSRACYSVSEGYRPPIRRRVSGDDRGIHSSGNRICRHARHKTLYNLKRLDLSNNQIKDIYLTLPSRPRLASDSVATRNPRRGKGATLLLDKEVARKTKADHILFPSLQTLYVSNNPITALPHDIGIQSKLGALHLNHTEVTRLPPELGLLSDLWDLQYQGLLLQDIEPSVLERKRTKDVVGYLRSILEKSKPYPNMKLMFVGISNIGKTTLLNQLRTEGTGSYQNSPPLGWAERQKRTKTGVVKGKQPNISTVGVDVSDWIYPKKSDFSFSGKDARPSIKFSTWDFGGQREYYATHQCFLSHRSLYLVMWKLTDGERGVIEVEQWLLNIQARAPDSPVIIVGTHYDLLTAEERKSDLPNMQEMIKDRYVAMEFGGHVYAPREKGLPKVMAMIEVSSKTGYNVRELRHMIYNIACEIKEKGSKTSLVDTLIPASYISVEEAVLNIRKRCSNDEQTPVLRSEQFISAVQAELERQGVHLRDLEELHQATRFLHDNGVLLHYDDPLLRDLYFVFPQWLCDMLAHVVTIREVNPHINNGVMKLSDLSHIFRSENFPANLNKQYINLLSKFEVALPWSSEYLLVPSLLPDSQQASSKPIAAGVSPTFERAMSAAAYTRSRVLRRQHVMSYVPSGFWPRLITRILADEEVRNVVKTCCQLAVDQEHLPGDWEKLASVAQPEWTCWKTGLELSCFGVKLLRVCELEGLPFYGAPENTAHPLHYRGDVHDTSMFNMIEVIAPSVTIIMEKFIQRRRVEKKKKSNMHNDDEDSPAESKKLVGFRVHDVLDTTLQYAARFLAITIEHIDNLITDWFPGLDTQTVQGHRLVTRLIPCPKCITSVCGVSEEIPVPPSKGNSQEKKQEGQIVDQMGQSLGDSGVGFSTTDGSSTSGSPWPSPVHAVKKDTSQNSFLDPNLAGEAAENSSRFTYKSVSSGFGTESSSCMEYTSDQSTDSRGSQESDGGWSLGRKAPQRKSGKQKKRQDSNDSAASRGSDSSDGYQRKASSNSADFNSSTKQSGSQKGSTDSTSSFKRGGKYGSFRSRKPTEGDVVLYAYEFEECVLHSYKEENLECPRHGQLSLHEVAPDVLFEDIAPDLCVKAENLKRSQFLGKGTFGSVFRGEMSRGDSGESKVVAMKMPMNNEVDEDASREVKQAAEAAKRALKENPTMTLNDAYRTVRQEMSILLPLRHPNIIPLVGFCLNPLSMLLEFAPLGALDKLLANYKRNGARLDPYVIQKCIVQCSSALKYLHKHHIIYRDLKSENVLVWSFPPPHSPDQGTYKVEIKLADYGISRSAAMAGMKGLGGTPGFMAPEIEKYVGKECYTEKVDTFSFGMYIYELITLQQPFNDLNPAQVKQLVVEGQRPKLTPKDKKAPVFALDVMSWCWQQEADHRPTSAQLFAIASTLEFPRLADVLTFDKQLIISCAVTAGSRVSLGCCADGRPSVGSDVWMCRNELNAGIGTGKINIISFSSGKCAHKEYLHSFRWPHIRKGVSCTLMFKKADTNIIQPVNYSKELTVSKSCIRVACSVGSTVWLGTESGVLFVYCAMTFKQLCKGAVKSSKYILSMIHVARCNWVLVALADGSVLAYNDNISNHYRHTGGGTPRHELLPSRVYTGTGNPVHCMASLPVKVHDSTEQERPSAEGSSRSSPEIDGYVCEVWCGQERSEITVLDGIELDKIKSMPVEYCDQDFPSVKEQSVSHMETCRTFGSIIDKDDVVARSIWVALFPGSQVFRWDAQEKRVVTSVDCAQYKPKFDAPKSGPKSSKSPGSRQNQLSATRAQVSSLLVMDKEMYVGTSWGCILVCNNLSLMVYTVVRTHEETISLLLPTVTPVVTQHSPTGRPKEKAMVLSCGRGYRNLSSVFRGTNVYPSQRSGKPMPKNESVMLVWLADEWETGNKAST